MDNKFFLNIKKHKAIFLVVLVVVLGIVLRLISIDKPNGFWFDEIYCHYIASQNFPFGIFDKLYNEDFHAPLYFIFLHFWMKMFGSSDVILRLFSCFCGVLAIPVFYFLGKEIKSSSFGIVAALFVALNSILIYYSQEVKFYSFLFLLSSSLLLFLIRYLKKPDRLNSCMLVVLNLAILYTFTVSFVYLFCINLLYLIYVCRNDKAGFKKLVGLYLIVIALYLPYVPVILHHSSLLSSYYISLSEVFCFNFSSALLAVQMWFSPVIYNLANGVPVPLANEYVLTPFFFLFGIFPSLVCLVGLINTIRKRGIYSAVLLMNIAFILLMFVSAFFHKFAFIPRYIAVAMPALLLFSMYGLSELKNKKTSMILISSYLVLNAFFLVTMPFSAPRLQRIEGYNNVAKILKTQNLATQSIISMPFAGEFLSRYYKGNILDLNFAKVYIKNDNNSFEMILPKEKIDVLTKQNARKELKQYIFSKEIPVGLNSYLNKNVYEKLSKGDEFVVVVNSGYFMNLENMTKEARLYDIYPMHHILYTKMVMHILDFSFKNLKLKKMLKDQTDIWLIYIFEKK